MVIGHEIKLISPQFVRPYVKGSKMILSMLKPAAKRITPVHAFRFA